MRSMLKNRQPAITNTLMVRSSWSTYIATHTASLARNAWLAGLGVTPTRCMPVPHAIIANPPTTTTTPRKALPHSLGEVARRAGGGPLKENTSMQLWEGWRRPVFTERKLRVAGWRPVNKPWATWLIRYDRSRAQHIMKHRGASVHH
jgi:hypothetical protein